MADIVYTPQYGAIGTNAPSATQKLTWDRIALLYGLRIAREGVAIGDNEVDTMYTCPAGKVFLLLTASLSVYNEDIGNGRISTLYIEPSNGTTANSNALLKVCTLPSTQGNADFSPAIPLILLPGEKINIFNKDQLMVTNGAMFGYEIDSALWNSLM